MQDPSEDYHNRTLEQNHGLVYIQTKIYGMFTINYIILTSYQGEPGIHNSDIIYLLLLGNHFFYRYRLVWVRQQQSQYSMYLALRILWNRFLFIKTINEIKITITINEGNSKVPSKSQKVISHGSRLFSKILNFSCSWRMALRESKKISPFELDIIIVWLISFSDFLYLRP